MYHQLHQIVFSNFFKNSIRIFFINFFSNFRYRSNEINYSDEDENSLEDSPQDEDPPYKVLNTVLKRYGTLSSLEKMPSDETDEKAYGSSDDEQDECDDDGERFSDSPPHYVLI